jgi:hypothetical protein
MSKPSDALTEPGDAAWGDAPVELGATMGRYQLRSVVGAGGMGVVFEALDPELARPVAVKVMRTTADPEAAARLRREGQAMAQLTHPNVIRVYDVGVAHGHAFVAMEFVAGTTLAGWLADARRSEAEILATFVQAGRGLAAAHAIGLVHRDFKPGNVLVGTDGRVLVTDFGLARTAEGARGGIAATLTRAGHFVGTPAYMAPEQYSTAAVDARADQFSFCVALWRALYGTPPYAGVAIEELVESAEANRLVPPPPDAAGRVPVRLRDALARGLRGAPAERFATMAELLAALEAPPPRRRAVAAVIAGAAVIAAGAGAWAIATRGAAPPAPAAPDAPRVAAAEPATPDAPIAIAFDAAPVADAASAPTDARRAPKARDPKAERIANWDKIPTRMGEAYGQIDPVLDPITRRAQRCGPWTDADNYEAHFEIDELGGVHGLEVTGPDPAIAACMRGMLARAKFGPSKLGGRVSLSFRR